MYLNLIVVLESFQKICWPATVNGLGSTAQAILQKDESNCIKFYWLEIQWNLVCDFGCEEYYII